MTAPHAPECAFRRWGGPCTCVPGGGRDDAHGVTGRMSPLLFIVAGPDAHGYVVDSFCKSFLPSAMAQVGLASGDVHPQGKRAIEQGLYRRVKTALERSRLVVGVPEQTPGMIVSACLHEPGEAGPLVHWLYVLHTMRRRKIGRATLEACGASTGGRYTNHTPAGASLARRFSLTFSPEDAT